jgi:uncharacterized protein
VSPGGVVELHMGFSLFPKTVKFYDLFMRQSQKMIESVSILRDIFLDFTDVEEKCGRIHIMEDDGILIHREIARELSRTFITPIDREDIHEINLAQKDIHNLINALATRIGLYGFSSINTSAKDLVNNLKMMIEEIDKMLVRLSHKKDVDEYCLNIKRIMDESEMLLILALGEIYEYNVNRPEIVLDVLDIIKWTQIYDRIEQAINRTESLANIIEGIVLKNA